MSTQRTKTRWATTAAAITAGLALSLTACGSGGEAPPEQEKTNSSVGHGGEDGSSEDNQEPSEGQPIAQVTGGDMSLAVTSADREEGGFVTVTGTLTNNGNGVWTGIEWKSDETELALKNPSSMAAAKLVDKKGKKRYYILRDTEGRCLCTAFKGGLKPGETTNWYAQFPAPPRGSDEVDFQIANMPPATITISEG